MAFELYMKGFYLICQKFDSAHGQALHLDLTLLWSGINSQGQSYSFAWVSKG